MKGLILLVLLSIFPVSGITALPKIIIRECYDGDTCTTIDGEIIRLACIDTPEIKGIKADPIPALRARDFLNKLIANEEVSIRRITIDRYGRSVAEIFKDNINIQELIVKEGLGKVYKKYAHQCEWSRNSQLN